MTEAREMFEGEKGREPGPPTLEDAFRFVSDADWEYIENLLIDKQAEKPFGQDVRPGFWLRVLSDAKAAKAAG